MKIYAKRPHTSVYVSSGGLVSFYNVFYSVQQAFIRKYSRQPAFNVGYLLLPGNEAIYVSDILFKSVKQ